MTFVYDEAAAELFKADLDCESATFKALLVDADSTADTERDAATISAFSDLSEADGANYARQTLANVNVAFDAGTHQLRVTANPTSFANLGANTSTEDNKGAVIYEVRGGDVDSQNLPVAWYDDGGFPFTPTGITIDITWDASGFIRGDAVVT